MSLRPFHIAFPVTDIAKARAFYGGVLRCEEGRSDTDWVDFNLYGHQIVAHRVDSMRPIAGHNPVDGDSVPVPHFGVVLSMDDWRMLAELLKAADVEFIIEPHIRFEGQPGEQGTMFFLDPFGNALEFKGFEDLDRLFAR